MPRAILMVMDSVGCGGAPDAAEFGDEGANTLGHIAVACAEGRADAGRRGPLNVPNLAALGLGPAIRLASGLETGLPDTAGGLWGAATEVSRGKDTPSGHWELAGVPVPWEWHYFPQTDPAIPPSVIEPIVARAGLPGTLCNAHSSGMPVIRAFGAEHIATGKPIFYTSADSVLQIAAHETHFGLDRLLALCEIAAEVVHPLRVGRVIARPFVGETADTFARTANRRDFAIPPPEPTLLDRVVAAGGQTFGVGKIGDIFAHRGITTLSKAPNDMALVDATLAAMAARRRRRPDLRQLRRLRHALRPPARRGRLRPRARGLRRPPAGGVRAAAPRRPADPDRRPRQRPDLARHRPHPRAGSGARRGARRSAARPDRLRRRRRDPGRAPRDPPGAARDQPAVTDWAALPKVELHLHLEGAAPPAFIRRLAAEKRIDLDGVFTADGGYAWTDFAEFLRTYEAACAVLRTPDDFRRLTAAVLEASAADGVIYTEIFLAPDLCGGGDPGAWPDYLAAIVEGAAAVPAVTTRFIATAIRHFGPDRAIAAARTTAAHPHPWLTGFGMGGEERFGDPADFAPAFAIAGEAGLGLTVHAGEIRGPESVAAALDALPVSRIGHGVRAIEDPDLVARLADRGIVLETNPGSNLALGLYPDWPSHPVARLRAAGRAGHALDRRPALLPHDADGRIRQPRGHLRLDAGRLRRDQPNRGRRRVLRRRHPRRHPRPTGPSMSNLTIVDHPLIQHKLTLMRERDTSTAVVPPAAARDLAAARLRGHPRPADDHDRRSRRR